MKKTASSEPRAPLFDRIFRPETITLQNGHTVLRPRSRTPLIAALVALALFLSVQVTGFDLAIVARRANQLTKILGQIFRPDPSFFKNVLPPLFDTIKMSIMGSVIGCLMALPFAVAASANINRNRALLAALRTAGVLASSAPATPDPGTDNTGGEDEESGNQETGDGA